MMSESSHSDNTLDLGAPKVHITDLPQEIINLIVDLVGETSSQYNKPAALHTCNAISRSFHTRAQQNLFERIEFIVDLNASHRAHRLRRVLETKPRLVSLVRSFKVVIREPRYLMEVLQPLKKRFGFNIKKPLAVAGSAKSESLIKELGTLGSKEHFVWLLQTISSAQVVHFSLVAPELEGGHHHHNHVDWSKLSESSQSLFLSIRSSLRLKSLELANISRLTNRMIIGDTSGGDDPRIRLVRQDSLPIQTLIIRRCRLETSSTVVFDVPSIGVPFRHLKTLDLTEFGEDASTSFLNELQSTLDTDSTRTSTSQPFQFPALLNLTVCLDCLSTRSTQSVQNLISSCRKTIKYLKLNVSNPEGDLLTSIHKLSLPRLRVLQELCISAKARNTDITQPYLRFVTRILRTASSSSSSSSNPPNLLQNLETLELSLQLETGNGREVQAAFGWEDLDEAIVGADNFSHTHTHTHTQNQLSQNQSQNGSGAFPNLRKVIISLKIEKMHYYGSDHNRPSSCRMIDAKNVLPLTSLSGRISIVVQNPALSEL